jgi:hypothetical protein
MHNLARVEGLGLRLPRSTAESSLRERRAAAASLSCPQYLWETPAETRDSTLTTGNVVQVRSPESEMINLRELENSLLIHRPGYH